MFRHVALIVCLTVTALAGGIAMVPGEREQWTMLVRDGRNQEAVKVLEAHYRAGRRDGDLVVQLYKLHMSFAEIDRSTRLLQDFVVERPRDPEAVALLARHYGDIQEKAAEIRALERLFELAPSIQTARILLTHYRLQGAFQSEETLLRVLLSNEMITANDAERLGLMLAARGDLYGARDALVRFDELANPERSIGRFVLFDVLVQTGDKAAALAKAASWIGYWRKASVHRVPGGETPSTRLIRMMMVVDETAARRLICQAPLKESLSQALRDAVCERKEPSSVSEVDATGTNAISRIDPRDELGRRRAQ